MAAPRKLTAKRKQGKSHLEKTFTDHLRALKLPPPVPEYRFHPTRKWRFDFCWPDRMLAVELEGGIFTNGGHTRGAAYHGNCDKYNAATMLGWKLLRFTPIHIREGTAMNLMAEALKIQ